jgi:acyl-CoA synthetase (AMP-forming)/AMP-acid ligase II
VSATSYTEGFQAATYSQMRTAVNCVAHLLNDKLGESQSFETLAYIGPNDLRYHIVLMAAMKMGYKVLIETYTLNCGLWLIREQMFIPSPRNSIVAQRELLARTECRILLTPDPEPPMVTGLLRENPMSMIKIPSLEELFKHDETIIPYVYVHEQKPLGYS